MSVMQQHYGLTDELMAGLKKAGVTERNLYDSVKLFDPDNTGDPISQISLLHYIDKKGSFNDPPANAHKLIAKAVFERLKIKEKIAVAEYLESWENNFED